MRGGQQYGPNLGNEKDVLKKTIISKINHKISNILSGLKQ
jgi:hypothetical protein